MLLEEFCRRVSDTPRSVFFLNRTNRSGYRVESIARVSSRIKLTRKDALKFLKDGVSRWPEQTLIYLDPPYYAKGCDLYYDFYEYEDHASVAEFVTNDLTRQRWIVSYDNVQPIRTLYKGSRRVVYDIGYSARSGSQGSEVMFFCAGLKVPPLIGPIKVTESHPGLFRRMA